MRSPALLVLCVVACSAPEPAPRTATPAAAQPLATAVADAGASASASDAEPPPRLVDAVRRAAEDEAAVAPLIDPGRGVRLVRFEEDLSGEDPRADAEGIIRGAELLCRPGEVGSLIRAAVEQDDVFETGSCRAAPRLVCEVLGGHDAPTYRLRFTGELAAPGQLEAIEVVQEGAMTEAWLRRARQYVDRQLAGLARKRCPR
jgi:hypothetical protein